MKNFSRKWISSSRPGKQRKFKANAPSHIKHNMISAHLSRELRKKYSRRAFPVRKGDTVEIEKGKFKGKKGKIIELNVKRMKAYIDGMNITKKDGNKVNVPITVSNLTILEFNLDDKMRVEALARKTKK